MIISLQYETCMARPCKWHGTRKELEVPCTTPHRSASSSCSCNTWERSHHTQHLHGVMELSAEQLIVGETIWRRLGTWATCCFNSWYHCLAFSTFPHVRREGQLLRTATVSRFTDDYSTLYRGSLYFEGNIDILDHKVCKRSCFNQINIIITTTTIWAVNLFLFLLPDVF